MLFLLKWNTFEFPTPLECPNGFYIAISHPSFFVSLGTSTPDDDYPYLPETHYYTTDFMTTPFMEIIDAPGIGAVIPMIRARGFDNGTGTKFGCARTENKRKVTHPETLLYTPTEPIITYNNVNNSALRSFMGYNVYRLEKGQTTGWTIIAEHETNLTYTDNTFSALPDAKIYQYAVRSLFSTGLSPATLSNDVPKGMEVNFTVNVNTNAGEPAVEAAITLTNQSGNTDHIYTATTDELGVAIMENVWRGTYNVSVVLTGFGRYFGTLDISEAGETTITLAEILYPVGTVTAEEVAPNVVVTWTEPELTENTYILDDNSFENVYYPNIPVSDASLGNFFNVEEMGEITSVDIFGRTVGNSTQPVTVTIYDENRNIIGTGAPFVLPANQWINVSLDNVQFAGAFYVMVRWQGTTQLTNGIGYDADGPNAKHRLSYVIMDGSWHVAEDVFPAAPLDAHRGVFMIRANVNAIGTASRGGDSKTTTEYRVYRLLDNQPEAEWTQLDDVTELTYTDTDWKSIPSGDYRYAVKTKYTGDFFSTPKISNLLQNENVMITVTAITNPVGSGTTTGSGTYPKGQDVTVSVIPNSGLNFKNWTVEGVEVSTDLSYTFTATEDVTLVANLTVGISDNELDAVVLYPNPFTNEIYITDFHLVKNISITNVLGETITNFTLPKKSISTANLSSGVYFITIESITGEKSIRKMIKN